MMHGEEDVATLLKRPKASNTFSPGATNGILSGVRHFVPLEAPAKVSGAAITMLGRSAVDR
jgi:hypothetical protein